MSEFMKEDVAARGRMAQGKVLAFRPFCSFGQTF